MSQMIRLGLTLFILRNADARYKTNKGNKSHLTLGDERDWCLARVDLVQNVC